MLGVGNGFSKGVYDNNALIDGRTTAMIDCGTTAWHSLYELGREREEVEEIFITHLHFDHSGGVESAALYGKYAAGKKLRLIVPKPIVGRIWDQVLKGTIENPADGLCCLEDYFQVEAPKEGEVFTLAGEKARWMRTNHVKGKFSCGLVLGERLFYTSDMVCDLPLVTAMLESGVQTVFHDCQLKNAQVHSDFETLLQYPQEVQSRMYLMHHGLKDESQAPASGGMRFLYQHREMEV